MRVLELNQGSKEWLAARTKYFTASECPAMMGASKYMSRSDLLKLKATGISADVTPSQQFIFDKGHAAEAAIRPTIEKLIGDELFPATATDDDGYLLASFDGINMAGTIVFEHKLWNEKLAAQVKAGELDDHYRWQMDQQLLVSGAEKAIFVVSDGTEECMVYCWYETSIKRCKQLLDGWKQFEIDLANYVPEAPAVEVVAEVITDLPALFVDLTGEVTGTNIAVYKTNALAFIEAINTDLQTDQDFVDAENTVKFCDKAEKELEGVKKQALAKTASIDDLFKTIDSLKDAMRTKRLQLDKLVKTRKQAIKSEIMQEAKNALADHIAAINARLKTVSLPAINADFAGAMKNKRTIQSLRDAVADELARMKIESNAVAERYSANLESLRELASDYKFLFSDVADIIRKDNDDLVSLIKLRIADHKQAETARLEREREQIRAEEERKAAAKIAAEAPVVVEQDEKHELCAGSEFPDTKAPAELPRTKRQALTDYQQGYIAGMKAYAHWKDGVEYVGTCGKTLEQAINQFLTEVA
jgi:putative phage-type endonuclease